MSSIEQGMTPPADVPAMPVDPNAFSNVVKAGPTKQADRIRSLDVLRGFAVLGILAMNITTFAIPFAAYANPNWNGPASDADMLTWKIMLFMFDMKMMTIFSMLFGAGIVLMASRRDAAGKGVYALHYKRIGWLFLFGFIHSALFWNGDILALYAACGVLVILVRKLPAVWLILIGMLLIAFASAVNFAVGLSFDHWPADAQSEMMKGLGEFWSPSAKQLDEQMAMYGGGPFDLMSFLSITGERIIFAILAVPFAFIFMWGWRAMGNMLIGMALYKMGVFSAKRSMAFYVAMTVLGFGIGWSLIAQAPGAYEAAEWGAVDSMFIISQWNYWGSLFVALGWVGVIMLVCKAQLPVLCTIRHAFACTGQMALTNYLMQTILCTTFFFPYGFGQFGDFTRSQLYIVVGTIWALQLIWSPIWMKHFRFGPFEWAWRSLTYWKRQPMRRLPVAPTPATAG
ncbi:MAG: DUF418 domain-containing protein [Planctomycetota bacterium]